MVPVEIDESGRIHVTLPEDEIPTPLKDLQDKIFARRKLPDGIELEKCPVVTAESSEDEKLRYLVCKYYSEYLKAKGERKTKVE